MSLQIRLALEGSLAKFMADAGKRVQVAARSAVIGYATRLKLKLRDDTRAGGLGDGVANAWQEKDYPSDGAGGVVALVYSKAPLIERAFGDDTTIAPLAGHYYLWIPTDAVPRAGNKRMTPSDVAAKFNQKFQIVKRPNGVAWAFLDLIAGKNGKGFRAKTKRRVAQGRSPKHVLMFILVQQVNLKKRLNWKAIEAAAKDDFEQYAAGEIARALEDE